jgi:hypothetical protein
LCATFALSTDFCCSSPPPQTLPLLIQSLSLPATDATAPTADSKASTALKAEALEDISALRVSTLSTVTQLIRDGTYGAIVNDLTALTSALLQLALYRPSVVTRRRFRAQAIRRISSDFACGVLLNRSGRSGCE